MRDKEMCQQANLYSAKKDLQISQRKFFHKACNFRFIYKKLYYYWKIVFSLEMLHVTKKCWEEKLFA